MKPVYIIADLHLTQDYDEGNNRFNEFIEKIFIPNSNTLYILGDLFEYWIGDDGIKMLGYQDIVARLCQLTQSGNAIYFMHGNRDFLVGQSFANHTGINLIDDPYKIRLFGKNCLLKHGDDLCTDDVEHQQFRKLSRNSQWQKAMLTKPIEQRLAIAEQLRKSSGSQYKAAEIMDVNQCAVAETFQQEDVDILIHGHTHRPGKHQSTLDGKIKQRIVLADWSNSMSYLKIDDNGFHLHYN